MNLKTLADKLGMSKTTVSRALNGYPEVSEKTRQRVLEAARECGYVANPMARSLAVGRTNVFGIIYPLLPSDLGDPMFLNVVGGLAENLQERAMNFIIAPVSPGHEMASYQQMVRDRRVDGLIVSRTLVHDERIAYLSRMGFPFIAHGRTQSSQPYPWFDYDNQAGIRLAVEHLLNLGHQRIAMISAPLEMNFAHQRRASFLDSMQSAGLAVPPDYLLEHAIDQISGHAAVTQLLQNPHRPSALIVDNHLAGAGVVAALQEQGLQLGQDISVVVWGKMDDVRCSITTIDQPDSRLAGVKMSEMLLALGKGTPISELQILWQPRLLAGASVAQL